MIALALLYKKLGRYEEAEPLYRSAIEAQEQVLSKEHPDTLISKNNLAVLYQAQGRYQEAELLLKDALKTTEQALSKEHFVTLVSVNNLADLYRDEGLYAEAEPLYLRALKARERLLGEDHPSTLQSMNNLALLYQRWDRLADAEPLFRRAREAFERKLGPLHPNTLRSVNNLAAFYEAQRRYGEAEPLYQSVLEARERVLGLEHIDTLTSVNNLAGLYEDLRRYGEAERLYKRALEAYERVLGKEHPLTLRIVSNIAALYFVQRDWAGAAQYWRRSTEGIAERVNRGVQEFSQGVTGKKKSEAEQLSWQFWGLVKAVYRLTPEATGPGAKASSEMFKIAEWAQSSEAAASLAQMAARGAKGNSKLAALARNRQDLVGEWQLHDLQRNTWLGLPADKRDAQAEGENNARLAAIDARIKEIDTEFRDRFPDYAVLATPAPLGVKETQAELRGDEALVLILDTVEANPTPEETFIWVVTKTDLLWVRSALGKSALQREVQALRCGLDPAIWFSTPPQPAAIQNCLDLLGLQRGPVRGEPLPFDLKRSHALYNALFGQAENLIKDKKLIIVPSGPLTSLPFSVLVTEAPDARLTGVDAYRNAAWLGMRQPITVLPSAASLQALRKYVRQSRAPNLFIGFGNPLLKGRLGGDRRAFSAQKCPLPAPASVLQIAEVAEPAGDFSQRFRGALADVKAVERLQPLPETTKELCSVARRLGIPESEIESRVWSGSRATETNLKRLNETGELATYRIVQFATHGLIAGEVKNLAEPALVLSPPETATETDDGLLTASEVTELKLDADWVVLSACNTAAGSAPNAEALSGLARAFFYAGARALLVSHWEVASEAAAKLTTGAFTAMEANPEIGRAGALKKAMAALITSGTSDAHPSNWGPFVVVGEGG